MDTLLVIAVGIFVVGFALFVQTEVAVRRLPAAVRARRLAIPSYRELTGALIMSAAVVLALIALGLGAL